MSKLTKKKAFDTTNLPGYGKTSQPESPEEYAKTLGIPLTKYDGHAAVALGGWGDDEWTADVELVDMGKDSSYGLAGAPIHFGKTAYTVMVVLKQHGQPILMLDPHQWEESGEKDAILNVIAAKLEQGKTILDKADDIAGAK